MTHKIITTGPVKGHPGACSAQFNHQIHSHKPHQHQQQPINPMNQQQMASYGQNGSSMGRPPVTPPYYY